MKSGTTFQVNDQNKLLFKLPALLLVFLFLFSPIAPVFAQTADDSSVATPVSDSSVLSTDQQQEPLRPPRPDAIDVAEGKASYSKDTNLTEATSSISPVLYTPEAAGEAKQKPQADLSSGALLYSVPISLPPGRNGLTPNLALSYNNQDDQHPNYLGDRWSLSIPSIQRLNKTGTEKLYTSNSFTSSQGGELVFVSGTTYIPKVENGDFSKYNFDGTTWTVTDKKGTVYTFGATAGSRQDDPSDATKVYKWMIETVRDTNNNFTKYSYYKNAGEIYPDSINYGGNGNTPGIFDVVFSREAYSPSTNVAPYLFYPNFKVSTAYRIKNITVSVNNQWVKKYDLAYTVGDAGFRVLLASMTTSGYATDTGITTTLPAETFSYKTRGEMGWDVAQTTNYILPVDVFSYPEPMMLQMQDINGDTYPDIFKADYTSYQGSGSGVWSVFINNTTSGWNSNTGSAWQTPTYFYNPFAYYRDYGTRIADINGDMHPDLVRSYSPTLSNDPPSISKVYMSNGDNPGWTENTNITLPIGLVFGSNTNADSGVIIADVNGDGFPDIVKSYLREGNDSNTNPIPPRIEQAVFLGTGNGWVAAPDGTWQIPFPFIDQNPNGSEIYTHAQLVDINGDHLPDIIWRGANPMWFPSGSPSYETFINNGHGWENNDASVWQAPQENILENDSQSQYGLSDGGAREADMNGDNLPDLLKAVRGSSSIDSFVNLNPGHQTHLASSAAGSSFKPKINLTSPEFSEYFATSSGSSNKTLIYGDANADGANDLLVKSSNNTTFFETSLGKPNNFTDTLMNVITPQGGTYTFAYKLSNQYRNTDNTLSNPKLPMVIDTINTITETDPVGNVAGTTTYSYADGVYYYNSPTDRKFAGFGKITETDPVGNKTVTYYHQGNSSDSTKGEYNDDEWKIGKPYRVEMTNSTGNFYSKTINKWDDSDLGNGSKFAKLIQTLNMTYDGNAAHKDTAQEYVYDNYGNLTQKTNWGEVTGSTDGSFGDTGTDKSSETIYYVVNSNNYLFGLPYLDRIADQGGNKIRESKMYYDNLVVLGSADIGNPTKTEQWKTGGTYINTQKIYNSYGLVTADTDANGNTTSYVYDTYNLYPASITNALNQATNFTYDYSSGKVTQKTDPNSFVYQTTYDGLGRPLVEKQPDLAAPTSLVVKTSYAYTDASEYVAVQKTDYLDGSFDSIVQTYFDGLGRKIQERKEAESGYSVKDFVYNSRALLDKESLPYNSFGPSRTSASTTTALYSNYTYDSMNRILSSINAVGITSYAYDDWKTTITDAKGKAKNYYKDAYDNLIKVEEINSGSTYATNYEWNLNKNLTKITDAIGNIRNFTYDGLGNILTAEDLHASSDTTYGSWSYSYDNAGNTRESISPEGKTVDYTYDALNRPLTEDYVGQAGIETTYAYDSAVNGIGKLASVTSSGASSSYSYNPLGGISSEIKTINSTDYQTDYTYDRQGNILQITNPDSSQIKYVYNNAGLLDRVQRKEAVDTLATFVASSEPATGTVKVLVVAGGGGGGGGRISGLYPGSGSGGGGGGYQYESSHTVISKVYPITVGDGGNGGVANTSGTQGGNSSFDTITATGGGYGGGGAMASKIGVDGGTGGSGGGGGAGNGTDYGSSPGGIGGSGSEGNNGGNGSPSWGGGGGGAGSVGIAGGYVSGGGNGGNGMMNIIAGSAFTYAGGGGGGKGYSGLGGRGGGGNGATTSTASVAGTNGLGGGGGGGYATGNYSSGAAGGKGVVIISYSGNGTDGISTASTGGTVTTVAGGQIVHTFTSSGTFVAVTNSVPPPPPDLSFTDVITNFDYSPTEQLTTISYANGTMTTNTYDANKLYRLSSKVTTGPGSIRLQDLSYTYDAVGNITKIVDASVTYGAKTVDYVYDDLNRLTSATATNVASGQSTYTQNYVYNAIGNITSGPLGTYVYGGNTGTNYANPHAATSINGVTNTYDKNGNLLSDGVLTNTWDYKGELAGTIKDTNTVNYYYDHAGNRVWMQNGGNNTYYVNKYYNIDSQDKKTKNIYAGDELVGTVETVTSTSPMPRTCIKINPLPLPQRIISGSKSGATSPQITPEPDIALPHKCIGGGVMTTFTTTPYYNHNDHLGSINVVTDSTGAQMELLDYYPFGSTRISSGSHTNQRQYIGQIYDLDTGLNYLNARYYNSNQGRFISEDSMFWQLPAELLIDPQQQNSYSYARDNPVNRKDPSGLIPTNKEAALMANQIYQTGHEGDNLTGGWNLSSTNSIGTGGEIGVYSRVKGDNSTEYSLVSRGTTNFFGSSDLSNNLGQPLGFSSDVNASLQFAQDFVKSNPNNEVTFVGHSKGGAEAALNAVETNKNAILFNPATANFSAYGLDYSAHKDQISTYIVNGEIINSTEGLVSKPAGNVTYLPTQHSLSSLGRLLFGPTMSSTIDAYNSYQNHSMESVINALNE